MQLFFIRHAQSTNNALWLETGSSEGRSDDPDLTDLGYRQAEVLAEHLMEPAVHTDDDEPTGYGLTHLYCSPMVRAVDTGWAVSKKLRLPLNIWVDLHEGGGIYLEDEPGMRNGRSGKSREYFEENYPGIVIPEEISSKGWWNRPYEQDEERLVRARRVLDELLAKHGNSNDHVAFFSHGDFFNRFLCVLLGFPLSYPLWFSAYNAGISRFDFVDGEIRVRYLNRFDFLPYVLRTR